LQTRGPATVNDLSPSLVLVLGSAHVKETAQEGSVEIYDIDISLTGDSNNFEAS